MSNPRWWNALGSLAKSRRSLEYGRICNTFHETAELIYPGSLWRSARQEVAPGVISTENKALLGLTIVSLGYSSSPAIAKLGLATKGKTQDEWNATFKIESSVRDNRAASH